MTGQDNFHFFWEHMSCCSPSVTCQSWIHKSSCSTWFPVTPRDLKCLTVNNQGEAEQRWIVFTWHLLCTGHITGKYPASRNIRAKSWLLLSHLISLTTSHLPFLSSLSYLIYSGEARIIKMYSNPFCVELHLNRWLDLCFGLLLV